MTRDPVYNAARSWYGYGRWDAQYWFIGPEPGMRADEGEKLLERCSAWERLGSLELMGCFEHHDAFDYLKWHNRTTRMKVPVQNRTHRPPMQATWRQLIRLLLAYKGERADNDAIGDYQCELWGSLNGEVCAPELSALAARSFSVKRDRTTYLDERTEHLRKRLVENVPQFVIMYGGGERLQSEWNYIASGIRGESPFTIESFAGWQAGFYSDGKTTFVRAAHPVNAGSAAPPDDFWRGIAEKLRLPSNANPQNTDATPAHVV